MVIASEQSQWARKRRYTRVTQGFTPAKNILTLGSLSCQRLAQDNPFDLLWIAIAIRPQSRMLSMLGSSNAYRPSRCQ